MRVILVACGTEFAMSLVQLLAFFTIERLPVTMQETNFMVKRTHLCPMCLDFTAVVCPVDFVIGNQWLLCLAILDDV